MTSITCTTMSSSVTVRPSPPSLLLNPVFCLPHYKILVGIHRFCVYTRRWAGRFLLLGAMVLGALWANNHEIFFLPILAQQEKASGVVDLAIPCILVISSVASVRRWCYGAFLLLHFLTSPVLFVTPYYHTLYVRMEPRTAGLRPDTRRPRLR
ncbi:hypothetical protein DFH08DRAFT_325862 [Mycena albidolilacea]|uniref:Ferric oxidoreductase domain-containing protein n=1 Tax=Mycena albidolilacea TaxID=1033008 RepID=A0AAD7F198_9AGAR|nr:hypothetical protein DFH08DRAFT_325862 [Mycena albidolilacea]